MADEVSWVTISRFLKKARAQQLAQKLGQVGVQSRLDPEGSTEDDLYRVKVPLEQASSAFEARRRNVKDDTRWPPPPAQRRGAREIFRKIVSFFRRATRMAHPDDTSINKALDLVSKDPASPEHRLQLARALLSLEDDYFEDIDRMDVLEWARLAIDEAMFLGAGPEATFELVEVSLEQEIPEEAAAWLREAAASGIDPARAAYLECELEFQRGNSKALKNAVSRYRRILEVPDYNLVNAAVLLFASGEKGAAARLADSALRDGEFASDEEWVSAAALKIAIEGAEPESIADLSAFFAGEQEAKEAVSEAKAELDDVRKRWKKAVAASKKQAIESDLAEMHEPAEVRKQRGRPSSRKQ